MDRNLSKLWVRTRHFDCGGLASISCWGTKILQATWDGWKKKSGAQLQVWIHWSRAPRKVTENRKIPKEEFGARSQAAALLLEWGITLAWGLDGVSIWIGLRRAVSSHMMPSLLTELEPRLGQVVLCMMSWDRKSLGSYLFFSAEKGLASVRMHAKTELDCLRPSGAQALGGRGLVLFTTAFSVCWHTPGA